MVQYRKAGRWVLIAAMTAAPGCKSGIPIWNPFAKPQSGAILERDSDGAYNQVPSATMPDPAPPTPRAEEFGWTAPFKKFGDTISAPFKKDKTVAKAAPKVEAEDDPVSLTSKVAPPGPSLYVSLAKLQEKAGKNESALEEYEKALELDKKNLPALLGKARLLDRMGESDKAVAAYKAAIDAHPDCAAAFNDLGVCYGRVNRLTDSAAALERAVALDNEKALYRNNLATVLVELGRSDDAYKALVKVHGEAIAHYNVGFLLNKRGQKRQALEQFQLANQADPNFAPARQWIESLGRDVAPQAAAPVAAQPTTNRTAQAAPSQIPPAVSRALSAAPKPIVEAPPVLDDPSLETPIPSPIVLPNQNEPKFSPVSQPRVVEESAAAKSEPTPLPPTEPTPTPTATDAADEAGPKLLGNEQARRGGSSTVGDRYAGERYTVGDRYSAPIAAQPKVAVEADVAKVPTNPMPAQRPAPRAPLPEQVTTRPAETTAKPEAGAKPAAETSVPSTAGARYPASRY